MIAVTRIPTHRNDGSKVSRKEWLAILRRVRETFDGFSLEQPSTGAWVAKDGQIYEEESCRLEVVVDRHRVDEARELFKSIGKQLGQRAIFFEVRDSGEIIDLEDESPT